MDDLVNPFKDFVKKLGGKSVNSQKKQEMKIVKMPIQGQGAGVNGEKVDI